MKNKKGFTLIEIIAVIVLLTVISLIVIDYSTHSSYHKGQDKRFP